MDDIKNKMYNYEATPPEGVWNAIAAELDSNEAKVIPIARRKNNTIYYLAAASIAVILLCIVFFTNRSSKTEGEQFVNTTTKQNDTGVIHNVIMTVPVEEKITGKNNEDLSVQSKTKKGGAEENLENDVNNDSADNTIAMNTPRYITIEGVQGQPVKISSKMATLIDSSETKLSSKPIWHKKIDEWREIMKVNTLAPTPGNFLDIVELTKALRDK